MKLKNELEVEFFHFAQKIKLFFHEQNYLEIIPPPLLSHPGIDPHIHPLKAEGCFSGPIPEAYLNTSPEFYLKKMLARGASKIYSLNYSYRDEPQSDLHRKQFLMLEWYRTQIPYLLIAKELTELLEYILGQSIVMKIMSVNDIFHEVLSIDLSEYYDKKKLYKYILSKHADIPLPEEEHLTFDDLFFLLFLNKIEPYLKKYPFLILKEYPAPLAALSVIPVENPQICHRFELFINGIEIANCYDELTDYEEQRQRSMTSLKFKEEHYKIKLPRPKILLDALEKGIPQSSGIALGVERLFYMLFKDKYNLQAPFFISEL